MTETIQNSNRSKFFAAATLIILIWLISIVQLIGIIPDIIPKLLPRNISGLPGIVGMPFTHGSLMHLISNTFPLIIFSALISLKGNKYFIEVTLMIILISGILLWLMGRGSYHVGASGLVFGYFGYLLARMFYAPSISAIIISMITFVLYSGILFGILPQGGRVSWEGHLFGLLAGIFVAKVMNNKNKS